MSPKKKAAKESEKSNVRPADFESSLERLEQIVLQLEQGDMGLSDSLVQYEEGISCLRQCQQALSEAEIKIEQLFRIDEDGVGHVREMEERP